MMTRENIYPYYQVLAEITKQRSLRLKEVLVDTSLKHHAISDAESLSVSKESTPYQLSDAVLTSISLAFRRRFSTLNAAEVDSIYTTILTTYFGNA